MRSRRTSNTPARRSRSFAHPEPRTPRPPRSHPTRPGRNVGRVVAVVSQKGGVGKTTTAVNLAAAFARRGLKTLIVDVDPQGAVRYGAGLRKGHETHGLADFLDGTRSMREVVLATQIPWLRVVLASTVSDS